MVHSLNRLCNTLYTFDCDDDGGEEDAPSSSNTLFRAAMARSNDDFCEGPLRAVDEADMSIL